MRIRFDSKAVVVSGVGHGFGRCIAETFARLGARVFGCDLSAAELAETAKAGISTEVLDLTDRGAAAARIAQIERTTGSAVDVLVNNAGGVAGTGDASHRGGAGCRMGPYFRGQHRCRLHVEQSSGGRHEASR